MKRLTNIMWCIGLLILGFGIGAFYLIGQSHYVFTSFQIYQEEFIIGGISFDLVLVIIALVTFIIAKLLKSKSKFKKALWVMTVVAAIFGVQAYFMVDTVLMMKHKVIKWEDGKEELRFRIDEDLTKKGYTKTENIGQCIIDQITYDDGFFNTLTDQQNMVLYLIENDKYEVYIQYCIE